MNEWQQRPENTSNIAGMEQEDEIDLGQLWGILKGGRWTIVGLVLLALLCGLFYLFVVQSTYRADALVQIQVEGSQPLQSVTSDLKQLTGKGSSPAQSEIPIIKSRSVLGDTVEKLNLQTTAAPAYFPVVGQAVAERREAGPAA